MKAKNRELKVEHRELEEEHRELKADHQALKSKFNKLEKQMAEIHQFIRPRIPGSSNLDQDPNPNLNPNRLLHSQGTNSTLNIS